MVHSDRGNEVRVPGAVEQCARRTVSEYLGMGWRRGGRLVRGPRYRVIEALKELRSQEYSAAAVVKFRDNLEDLYEDLSEISDVEGQVRTLHVLAGMLLFAESIWENAEGVTWLNC